MFFTKGIKKLVSIIGYNYAIVSDTIKYRNRIVNYTGHDTNNCVIPIYISTKLVKWYTNIDESVPVGIALLNKQGRPVILINDACDNYTFKDVIIKHELGHIKRGHLTSYSTISKLDRELHADIYAVNTLGYGRVMSWLYDYKRRLQFYGDSLTTVTCRIKNLNRLYGTGFSVFKKL